jgi:hypothetical protein
MAEKLHSREKRKLHPPLRPTNFNPEISSPATETAVTETSTK